VSTLAFGLPPSLEAHEPPARRDHVKLMVAHRGGGRIEHVRFSELPELLAPGDLLVVNVSATLPAAVPAQRSDGMTVRVHFSTRAPGLDPSWRVVELRSPDGSRPQPARAGEVIELAGGATLELVAPYASGARLMLARVHSAEPVEDYLPRFGEPIRYGYVRECWPLNDYQNVYATTPGSAEMPSAGRPFTPELITRLVASGILLAPITLHTGVSSPERHEPPFPEQYDVPAATARLVNTIREAGGRVIAVGTTVVRALETAAAPDGTVAPGSGWTGLVIGPERPTRTVDGLITGWHEPEASHLQMLEAIAGHDLLTRSYTEALEHAYLWHEFGDSHLII
jgi:S-adenosylmethionine:tRNA ribosyltransferase-isomerase